MHTFSTMCALPIVLVQKIRDDLRAERAAEDARIVAIELQQLAVGHAAKSKALDQRIAVRTTYTHNHTIINIKCALYTIVQPPTSNVLCSYSHTALLHSSHAITDQ
jgi:hypothetical protein